MSKIIVAGGRKLEGEIRVPGAKNTVLPILAATVISGKKSVIHDCPLISDVKLTLDILKQLGCEVTVEGSTVTVDSAGFDCATLTDEWMHKMRSSIILTGAILSRCGRVRTSYPGGCELGLRPIDLHIKAFKEMGVKVEEQHGCLDCTMEHPKACDIHLGFPSVGATENIMLAAVGVKGTTRIINAAKEPEIEDLQDFLNKIGANVRGAGTSVVEIEGCDSFRDAEHRVIPDRIVAATYLSAAAITASTVEVANVNTEHISAVIAAMREMGVKICKTRRGSLVVSGNARLRPLNILRTTPYPGFPTDAQSIFTTMLSVADGTSILIESIFEQRFKHIDELIKMGANITVDGRTAVIKGVDKLYGAKVSAPDLRSGAALVLAGLRAEGETIVDGISHIERGYEDIVRDLNSLGAEIKRMD